MSSTSFASRFLIFNFHNFPGTVFDVSIMDAKSASYQALMPEKPKEDLSSKLISPMPGTVVSINVEVGDEVHAGQSVAVVEAMKMQNGLR